MFPTFASSNIPAFAAISPFTAMASDVIALEEMLSMFAVVESMLPAITLPFDFMSSTSISFALTLFTVRFSTDQFIMLAVATVISSKVALAPFTSPVTVRFPPTVKSEAIVAKSAVKEANAVIPETVNDVMLAEVNVAFVASSTEMTALIAFICPVVMFSPIEAMYCDNFSEVFVNEADMAII